MKLTALFPVLILSLPGLALGELKDLQQSISGMT